MGSSARACTAWKTLRRRAPYARGTPESADTICRSRFDPSEAGLPAGERTIFGDATEVGLLRFASGVVDAPALPDKHRKVFEIPFNSTNKWQLSIHEEHAEDSEYTLLMKGAPERVLRYCQYYKLGDDVCPIEHQFLADLNAAYERFAKRGQRVLAFAKKMLPRSMHPEGYRFEAGDPPNFDMHSLVFAGLLSLMDPPKKGVRRAIQACRTAGIQVVMVTGDHPTTAEVRPMPPPPV